VTRRGLYIHIPFCRFRCDYCDFFTRTAVPAGRQEAIVRRILEEVTAGAERWNRGSQDFRTIYVGGGTPSSLDPSVRETLLTGVRNLAAVPSGSNREVTVEVNPEDIDPALLTDLWAAGVNRLSVGAQSLREEALATIGRHTDREATIRGLDLVASRWQGSWSADLITAIPGLTPEESAGDARDLLTWNPSHLSVYELGIEMKTRLAWRVRRGEIVPPVDAERRHHIEAVGDALAGEGLLRYETSSYARPGAESAHNTGYWRMIPWLAAGPGAVGLVPAGGSPAHITGTREFASYLSRRDFGTTMEVLSSRELLEEYLMGGMRMTRGLDRDAVRKAFGFDITRFLPRTLSRWNRRLAGSDGEHLRLDEEGSYLVDAFLVDAFTELDETAALLPEPAAWPVTEGTDDANTVAATT
jgi:oxygen-independent coproporphyrinogen-3 oxidase